MSADQRARKYASPIKTVPPRDRSSRACAPIDTAKAVAIFLSLDDIRDTAKMHGVSQSAVAAIWSRLRDAAATARLKRPSRAEIESHRAKRPRRKSAVRLSVEAFVSQHAASMTAIEMAAHLGCTAHHVRLVCREMGLTPLSPSEPPSTAGRRTDLQPNAVEGFEPAPCVDRDLRLDAPPGTDARIAKLRERAERGVELWDEGEVKPLPRCGAKIEAPQLEAIL